MTKLSKVIMAIGIVGGIASILGLIMTQLGDFVIGINIVISGLTVMVLCGLALQIEYTIYNRQNNESHK